MNIKRLINYTYEYNTNYYIELLVKCQNLKDRLELRCEKTLLLKNKKFNFKTLKLNLKLNNLIIKLNRVKCVLDFQKLIVNKDKLVLG